MRPHPATHLIAGDKGWIEAVDVRGSPERGGNAHTGWDRPNRSGRLRAGSWRRTDVTQAFAGETASVEHHQQERQHARELHRKNLALDRTGPPACSPARCPARMSPNRTR